VTTFSVFLSFKDKTAEQKLHEEGRCSFLTTMLLHSFLLSYPSLAFYSSQTSMQNSRISFCVDHSFVYVYALCRHECVAMHLSRMELQVAFDTLLRRLPSLRLAVPESEVQFSPPTKDLGISEMKVTWD